MATQCPHCRGFGRMRGTNRICFLCGGSGFVNEKPAEATTPDIPEDVDIKEIGRVKAFEYLKQSLDCFVKFIPEKIATDDTKQMAMYSALHLVKDAINELTEAQTHSPAIPSSIVRRLEEMNPYAYSGDNPERHIEYEVWNECVSKLTELLSAQPEIKLEEDINVAMAEGAEFVVTRMVGDDPQPAEQGGKQ